MASRTSWPVVRFRERHEVPSMTYHGTPGSSVSRRNRSMSGVAAGSRSDTTQSSSSTRHPSRGFFFAFFSRFSCSARGRWNHSFSTSVPSATSSACIRCRCRANASSSSSLMLPSRRWLITRSTPPAQMPVRPLAGSAIHVRQKRGRSDSSCVSSRNTAVSRYRLSIHSWRMLTVSFAPWRSSPATTTTAANPALRRSYCALRRSTRSCGRAASYVDLATRSPRTASSSKRHSPFVGRTRTRSPYRARAKLALDRPARG